MEGHNFIKIASIGDHASVEICEKCENGTVHINFLNTSLRMCREQFHAFTVMLNKAMMQIYQDDDIFKSITELFDTVDNLKVKTTGEKNMN